MRHHRQRVVVLHGPDELDRRLAAAQAPVDPRRETLYTAAELYDRPSYADCLDHLAYAWSRDVQTPDALLARALHDEGVDNALGAWVKGRSIVGVMGGHAVERGQPEYAGAARLGRLLAQRATVATGGGPGAMEATNLGARLSGSPDDTLHEALTRLAAAPSFRPSVDAWLTAARDVLSSYPDAVDSLGVPTWHYGHEPPNPFATAIAKYFRNALREAILLLICDAGIVFLPGAGGTVQEIFQDACENYYAEEGDVARMVLVGRRYWTEDLPAWPLLASLAKGRPMEARIHLVDTVEEAAALF